MKFKKTATLRLYNTLGTIHSANVVNDVIYVVNREGRIVKLKGMDFLGVTLGNISFPPIYNPLVVCMFLRFSVIYSGEWFC